MNSIAMSLAALILSGVKSLASILVETSIARTMSIPSVSTFSIFVDDLGLAMATTINDSAAILRTNGICLTTPRTDLPPDFQGLTFETLRCGLLSLISTYR